MSVYVVPRQLRDLLIELYTTEETSKRVVEDAEMVWTHIEFSSAAIINWHAILQEAHRRRRVIALLEVAAHDYKERLLDVAQAKLLYLVSLADLSVPTIRHLYQQSRPTTLERQIAINTHEDALNALWHMVDQQDRRLPILEFAERLACHVQDFQLAEQLRQWSDWLVASTALCNVARGDLQELRTRLVTVTRQPENAQSAESYLLVEIWPDAKTRKSNIHQRFWINIYLWKNEDNTVCWHSQDRSYKVAEIPQLVYDTLNDHEEETPTTIEFLLPFELLADKVDQWQVEAGFGLKNILGHHYRLVVRSRDRLRERGRGFGEARKAWRKRWDLFCSNQERHVFWCCRPDEYAPQQLYERLALTPEKAVCLGMTFAPTVSRRDLRQPDLLTTILMTGIPVILWPHWQYMQDKIESLRQTLETLLQADNLPRLPTIILDLRCTAALSDREHLGHHLALFWDDPDRQPPVPNRDMSTL